MRERVERLVGDDCRGIWVSTFHALCARLLRREAPAIHLSRDFVIYDSSDQLSVVKQALKTLNIDDKLVPPRAALSRISQAKNKMESPEAMRSAGWNLRDQQISRVFEFYQRALTEASALDFDDLLLKTLSLVEDVPRVREFYARKFKYVLVDEYQDTNRPAVPARSPPRRDPSQSLRRRRSGSVHLQVARRGPPQHPRLRAGLSRRPGGEARAELPVDAGHSRRGVGRDPAQSEPPRQASLDRPARRGAHPLRPRRGRD